MTCLPTPPSGSLQSIPVPRGLSRKGWRSLGGSGDKSSPLVSWGALSFSSGCWSDFLGWNQFTGPGDWSFSKKQTFFFLRSQHDFFQGKFLSSFKVSRLFEGQIFGLFFEDIDHDEIVICWDHRPPPPPNPTGPHTRGLGGRGMMHQTCTMSQWHSQK